MYRGTPTTNLPRGAGEECLLRDGVTPYLCAQPYLPRTSSETSSVAASNRRHGISCSTAWRARHPTSGPRPRR